MPTLTASSASRRRRTLRKGEVMSVSVFGAVLMLTIAVVPATSVAASWNPATFAGESTLQLKTTAAGESEHWFPVWVVVVDDDVYVRLGSRAASRMARNATAPYVAVRVGGQQFDRVKAVPVPEKAVAVAAAMSRKYW